MPQSASPDTGPSAAELSAEFAGTTLLMLFGLGVEAQTATAVPAGSMGGHDSITWAWGLGVTIACYVAARLSGAHLNPAVTVALAVCNGFPWRKVAGYVAAQCVGAAVAAVLVRALYQDLIAKVDPGFTSATQTVFSTSPGAGVTLHTALFDQVLGTAVLVFVVCALTAASNNPPLSNLEPVVVGLLVVAIGMAWGANAGYAINPARDLPPRLVSWLTGYGTAWVDLNGDAYWWVPVVGPFVGGVLGAALFKLAIGRFLPEPEGGVDPFADRNPQLTARERLAERLATARDEATSAARRAYDAEQHRPSYPTYPEPYAGHGFGDTGPQPVPPRPRVAPDDWNGGWHAGPDRPGAWTTSGAPTTRGW